MSLVLENITISSSEGILISDFHLEVSNGEVVTIMGPSGCGKSTLLSGISGCLSTEFSMAGSIYLHGLPIDHIPMENRNIGILFQDDLLFPHLDVLGNLCFGIPHSRGKEEKKGLVAEALEKAELAGFEKRDIATLSGGQRARISVLRSLLADPAALLLDEPFSKLDKDLQSIFRDFVFQQIRSQNIPSILVTHNISDSDGGKVIHLADFTPKRGVDSGYA